MGVVAPLADDGVTHGMCRRCAERVRREQAGVRPHFLIVVRRDAPTAGGRLLDALRDLHAVTVVVDRRQRERRTSREAVAAERRQLDRRRPMATQREAWSALGLQVVPVATSGAPGARRPGESPLAS